MPGTNPMTVSLTIGNDGGTTVVTAKIERDHDGRHHDKRDKGHDGRDKDDRHDDGDRRRGDGQARLHLVDLAPERRGTTGEELSIITCLTSFAVNGDGMTPASRAFRPADCTMPSIDAMNGVAPDVLVPYPLKMLCVP